jgi:chromosome segregation ATPase
MAQPGNQPPAPDQPAPKEPFVAGEERPEVRLNPDMPVAEMRVRDLAELLGLQTSKSVAAEAGSLKKPEIKDFKFEKWEHKHELKDHKYEKWEHKNELKDLKNEKWETKPEIKDKPEKFEKWEHKDHKLEKFEHKDPLIEAVKREPELPPGPVQQFDPRLDDVIRQISDLAKEVAALKERLGG